jgi:uncharacterized protein YbjT (DUF2867 family)
MYVVTGATGNTGSVVASHLLAAGKKVRGIGRSAERLQRLAQKGGEPFVASLTDTEALTRAFQGANAVYVMIPPDYSAPDVRAQQRDVTESIAAALERSGVKYAVALSSFGADKAEKTGPVVGLHRMEQRLNRIAGLNVLHLRAGYFMENTLAQVSVIHKMGMAIGALLPYLRIPMIATRDIGAAAAEALLGLDFDSHQTRELLGANDITMTEAASIIGKAIGKSDLKYTQVPNDQLRSAMLQMGMSEDMVAQLLEMSASLNSGHMKALEPRSARNTTPTSFVTFVHQEFLPQYKSRGKAAA